MRSGSRCIVDDLYGFVERPFMAGFRLVQLAYAALDAPGVDRRHATLSGPSSFLGTDRGFKGDTPIEPRPRQR